MQHQFYNSTLCSLDYPYYLVCCVYIRYTSYFGTSD
jgi:hypothetical protein